MENGSQSCTWAQSTRKASCSVAFWVGQGFTRKGQNTAEFLGLPQHENAHPSLPRPLQSLLLLPASKKHILCEAFPGPPQPSPQEDSVWRSPLQCSPWGVLPVGSAPHELFVRLINPLPLLLFSAGGCALCSVPQPVDYE